MSARFPLRARFARLGAAGLMAASLALPAVARAEEPAAPLPPSLQVLKRVSDTLAAAKHVTFHAEIHFDASPGDGLLVQLAGAVDVALSRPDGLRIDYRDDASSKLLWYDGKTVTLLDRADGLVASEAVPATLDAAIQELRTRYGLELPLSTLLSSDLYAAASPRLIGGAYLGVHDADGMPCDHVAYEGPDHDWELWVEKGKVPLLRKLLMRSKELPGSPQYEAVFTEWDLDAKFAAKEFQAEVPKDATPVEFVVLKGKGEGAQ